MAVAAKKRIDPKPQPELYDPDEDLGQVLGRDPERDYVWAYKVGGAVGRYENLGYDIETVRPDGPRAMTQSKRQSKALDTPVEWNDNILMSRPKSVSEQHYERSQRKAQRMEDSVISRDGPADPTRGIHRFQRGRTAVGLENTTSNLVPDDSI